MTFYEAAVEILRAAGRPLHYKKITQLSIDGNLLTHVGRTPEQTMAARLAQEVAKTSGDTVIEQVRPGVYALREGADTSEARQTIRLREPVVEEEESEELPASPDTVEEEEAQDADGSEESAAESDEEPTEQRSGRRRRRRGGRRNRDRDENTEEHTNDDADQGEEDAEAPSPEDRQDRQRLVSLLQERGDRDERPDSGERQPREVRQPRSERPQREERQPRNERPQREGRQPRQRPPKGAAAAHDPAGDLAREISLTLAARGSQYLRDIGRALRDTAYSEVPTLGATAIRRAMESANERRTSAGRPPIFTEVASDQWALATANDDDLGASYAALDQWQMQHEELLAQRLASLLHARSSDQLIGIVSLVIERLGFTRIERHEAVSGEIATFSATLSAGLADERFALRIVRGDVKLGRADVMNFRGSLHLYEASRGVIIAIGGSDQGAQEQSRVPNLAPITLIDDVSLAKSMIRAGVGVVRFTVDAACLDDALFG